MKHYPSIDHEIRKGVSIIAFDKLDGSCTSSLWKYKKGFHRFSSRTQLIDEKTNELGKYSIPLMKEKESELEYIIKDSYKKEIWSKEEFIFFFEFYGPSSFAGVHNWNESHKVTLIDLNVSRQGLIGSRQFVNLFKDKTDMAQVLYEGNITEDLILSVRNRTLPGITFEGIVCKQSVKNKVGELPYMTKIKTNEWINKVKGLYSDPDMLKKLL